MSFYAKLEFNQNDMDREYVIRTVSNREYRFKKSTADLKLEPQDGMLIFTTENNYRVALSCSKIESVTYDNAG